MSLDELLGPLRAHLAPRLSDYLLIGLIGGASKRLEGAIKRVSLFSPYFHIQVEKATLTHSIFVLLSNLNRINLHR